VLDPASNLARAEWLVIGDAVGQAKGARIVAAAELTGEDVETHLAGMIEKRSIVRWNAEEARAEARLERRLGAITLASGPDPDPDAEAIVDTLVEKVLEDMGVFLPADLLARGRFAGLDALSIDHLAQISEQWLHPLLHGRRDLNIAPGKLVDALISTLSWDEQQALAKRAPREFTSLAGSSHLIEYAGDDAPSVEVRVQALFGLDQQPMIWETPLLLKLTSPAGRPIQSTRDLPGFWRGSWADVRKDMKGRYPKHRWPDEPWSEVASLKTKNAFSNRKS